MTRILITGMSGVGKSSALAQLARLGHRVVDTDSTDLTRWVDVAEEFAGGEWLWVEDRVEELLNSSGDDETLFISGCVRNQGTFYDRFDAIVLLSAPAEVILDRIAGRTTNDFGKSDAERAIVLHDLAATEPLLRRGCTHEIDATQPLDRVVDELLAIAGAPRAVPG